MHRVNDLAGLFTLTDTIVITQALTVYHHTPGAISPEQAAKLRDLFREVTEQIARDEFAGDYDYPDDYTPEDDQ